MTETIDTAQPEALRLATHLEGFFISEEVTANMARKIAAELRRLYSLQEERDKWQSQHDRDSRELRNLSKARDTARRERDAAKVALAAAEARNATLTDDAARLDWLTFNLSGKALRDIGVVWAEHGDARRAIDAARAAASISTKEGDTHADQG